MNTLPIVAVLIGIPLVTIAAILYWLQEYRKHKSIPTSFTP